MEKSGSIRLGKSKGGSSSSRSRGGATRSASSPSVKRMIEKAGAIEPASAKRVPRPVIDWAKIDATSETEIEHHARADRSKTPSDRTWNAMVRDGGIAIVPSHVDVRRIREKLQLSQSQFAARFGFTPAAVRQWEQGRRHPHGSARILLTIIDREPGAVRRALRTAPK